MELTIEPAAPFDFDLTAHYRTSYRKYFGNHEYVDGEYRQIVASSDKVALACVKSVGTLDRPKLKLTLRGDHPELWELAAREVAWALGTDTSLSGFYALSREDPPLNTYVQQLYGLHPTRNTSLFETIVLAITGQQIAAGVAHAIRGLVVQEFGRPVVIDGESYNLFPTPEALAEAGVTGLRAVKLSTRKAEYIVELASRVASGDLDLEACRGLPSADADELLLGLRGIGKWTVQWLKITAMDYPDAFPSGDLALRRFISHLYMDGSPLDESAVEDFSRRWQDHRTLVTVYLFAAARMGLLNTRKG
ncbi:MAG: DNA-3-methyladenine glycosylase 2 family protein [Dehalococcoidia bacterium]|nr:DNA-3-methyladenine glycosylase 2 family protein [Dehalococcoidia bacterium]